MQQNNNNLYKKRVSVVIVNYKTAELVMQSVLSLLEEIAHLPELFVYVIDNSSQDGSQGKLIDFIQENQIDNRVKLLSMPLNGGFAYGSNAGIRQALVHQSDYIMLLNPDTIIRQGAVSHLVAFLEQHSHVGIVGSQLENIDGHVENSAHRFPSIFGQLIESSRLAVLDKLFPNYVLTYPATDMAHQSDWVSGSSMMVRKEVFENVGLLDESYFLYFEEVDFFRRVNHAGWQTWYVPESKVMHMEGVSTGIKLAKRRPAYWYESRRRYFIKHSGVFGLIAADLMWTMGRLGYLSRKLLKLGAQQKNNDPKWLMWDLLSGDILAVLSGNAWRLKQEKIN
jgi:N-acetylglucosaminyl-diphospho-decaprenol L-rhamnosyltransferase